MAQSPITYEWECPVCGIMGISSTHITVSPVEDEAEDAISRHVRRTA